jgi:peptidoglycan/xylan/chitin deacetylase (PgdA/CDA1 family)
MRPVPVLMFHHVNPHEGDMITVTPDVFEGQMKYLSESGYKTLRLEELLSYITGESVLKERAVVLTFDDGWLDNYHYVFPILKRYAIQATIFIVSGWIQRASEQHEQVVVPPVPTHKESKALIQAGKEHRAVLTWDRIREMAASDLVDFYSHAQSHIRCDRLQETELFEELGNSKRTIEEKLGRPCPYLCWPNGAYSDMAVRIAREVGYRALFTTSHGVAKLGSNPLAVKRIVVKDDVAWFKKRMVVYSNRFLSRFYLTIKKK